MRVHTKDSNSGKLMNVFHYTERIYTGIYHGFYIEKSNAIHQYDRIIGLFDNGIPYSLDKFTMKEHT